MDDEPITAPRRFERRDTVSMQSEVMEQFTYGPADEEALAQRQARTAAATQAAMAIEAAIANVAPTPIDALLVERRSTHGDFTDDAATAQALKYIMRKGVNWDEMPPFMREALDQMQTKIARLLAGDFRHPDAWRDLQGYPRLVEQRL